MTWMEIVKFKYCNKRQKGGAAGETPFLRMDFIDSEMGGMGEGKELNIFNVMKPVFL